MKLSNSQGFTLIELLVVMTIMGLMMGVGMMAYGRIQEDQNLKKSYKDALIALTEAQQNAFLGKKDICTADEVLVSYIFSFVDGTGGYQINAICSDGKTPPTITSSPTTKTGTLSKGTIFKAISGTTVEFESVTRELTSGTSFTFSIENSSGARVVEITQFGDIREDGK
ncbi:type II secretion system protein [Candidatus Beckwithbacteria bacterium]|nr:type II secretion system protein [Candidatus Beckwithbacteria bacterium]